MSSMLSGFSPELDQAVEALSPDGGKPTPTTASEGLNAVVTDVARGVTGAIPAAARGAAGAISELGASAQDLLEGGANLVEGTSETAASVLRTVAQGPNLVRRGGAWVRDLMPEPESYTGKGIEAIAQFLTGFGLWGKALNAVGASSRAIGVVPNVLAREFLAGGTAFDPYEARLSNLLQEVPALQNPVLDFLSASPEDSVAEARFKAALENGGLAGIAEGLFYSVKALRAARSGDMVQAQENAKAAAGAMPQSTTTITTETLSLRVQEDRWLRVSESQTDFRTVELEASRKATDRTTTTDTTRSTTTTTGEPGVAPTPEVTAPLGPQRIRGSAVEVTDEEAARIAAAWQRARFDPEALSRDPDAGIIWRNLDRMETPDDVLALVRTLETSFEAGYRNARVAKVNLRDLTEQAEEWADAAALIATGDAGQARMLRHAMEAELQSAEKVGRRAAAFTALTVNLQRRATELADEIVNISTGRSTADPNETYRRFLSVLNVLANVDPLTLGMRSQMGQNLSILRGITSRAASRAPDVGAAARMPETNPAQRTRTTDSQSTRTTNTRTFTESIGFRATEGSVWESSIEGGERFIVELAYRVRTVQRSGPGPLRKAVQKTFENPNSIWDAASNTWQAGILSGLQTHVLNVTTNAFRTGIGEPAERVFVRLLDGRPLMAAREGWNYYSGMMMGLGDAVVHAAEAFRRADGVTDPGRAFQGERNVRALSASTFGTDEGLLGDALLNGLGELVRLNSRVMAFEDEFFKRLTVRATVQANAAREGVDMGLSGQNLRTYVQGRLSAAFDPVDGRALDQEGLQAARVATFTQDFGTDWVGRFGNWLDRGKNQFPPLRYVIPFVRTPSNILSEFAVYNPVSAISGPILFKERARLWQEFAAGGDTARRAGARIATATALLSSAAYFVLSGDITGGGTRDPNTNRAMNSFGVGGYSVRFTEPDGTERFVRIDRLDPYSYPFMVLATAKELMDRAEGDLRVEESYGQLALMVALGVAKAIADKSYAQGLLNMVASLYRGDAQQFVQGVAAGFVPGAHRDLETFLTGNPYMREANTILDAMKARTAAVETLDPRFTVLGEPVPVPQAFGVGASFLPTEFWHVASPVRESRIPGADVVTKELLRLMDIHKNAFLPPPHLLENAINLREFPRADGRGTAYGRYQELIGETRIAGKTLREALTDLITSDRYKALGDGTVDIDGPRLRETQAVIQEYRQTALEGLFREFPAVEQALMARRALTESIMEGRGPSTPRDNRPTGLLDAIRRLSQ